VPSGGRWVLKLREKRKEILMIATSRNAGGEAETIIKKKEISSQTQGEVKIDLRVSDGGREKEESNREDLSGKKERRQRQVVFAVKKEDNQTTL